MQAHRTRENEELREIATIAMAKVKNALQANAALLVKEEGGTDAVVGSPAEWHGCVAMRRQLALAAGACINTAYRPRAGHTPGREAAPRRTSFILTGSPLSSLVAAQFCSKFWLRA